MMIPQFSFPKGGLPTVGALELPVAADAPGAPHFGAQEGAGAMENRCMGEG